MRLFLLLVISAGVARAQSAVAPLSPVVVTATRIETSVAAPASVTVLAGDSLRARGITHLADALRLVPGVTVVASSSFGSQSSLFVRGGQGNFVRVLLDGVPVNEPGGAIDLGALTLDNVDRVEIVRGPASVLYGEDAVTGVIQLVSKTGAFGRRGSVSLGAGSYQQRDVRLAAEAGSERASVSASLSDMSTAGILPFNNAYRNRAAAMALRLRPDTRTSATLAARWQAATYHYPTESDGSVHDLNAENTSHRLSVSFAGVRALSDRLSAAWAVASSEYAPRANDGPDSQADTVGFYGFFSRGTVTRRSADLRLTARAGATQSLTLGAEASRDRERSSTRSLSEYGVESGDFAASRSSRAVYAQAVGAALGRGSYQVGARLDDNSAFGTFRTVRVGAAWQLAPAWRVRAAAGTAFRAPSFFENFATGYVRGNPRLTPERSRSGELALEGAVSGLSFSLTAYRQRFDNLIQYTSVAPTRDAPNYYNVAGASADGVEAEAALAFPRALSARLSYGYLRTRVTNAGFDRGNSATFVLGESLLRRPAHTARAELARRFASRVDLTLGAAYSGRAADRDYASWPAAPVILPQRTLVDVAAIARLSRTGARVPLHALLRADNLTNVQYQGTFGFRAPGRSLRAGLTVGAP